MRRMPIPRRRSFQRAAMPRRLLCGIRPGFPGLFPCGGQVAYVLLTSAPVAIGVIARPMLPLDLHVLSLSLAFILSQDQTLRCAYLLFLPSGCLLRRGLIEPARPAMAVCSLCLCTCSELGTGTWLSLSSVLYYFFSLLQHFNDLSPANRPAGAKSGAKLLPTRDMAKCFHAFFEKKRAAEGQRAARQPLARSPPDARAGAVPPSNGDRPACGRADAPEGRGVYLII